MIKQLSDKKKYMILLFCIMAVWAVKLFPFKFGGWNQVMLAFSYRYGFIQRAFIGSVIDVVSVVFHIPLRYMRYIYGIITMSIFTGMIMFWAYKGQGKEEMDRQTRAFLKGMALVFLLGPGWNTNYNNFALTDVWLMILSVIGFQAVMREKNTWLAVVVAVICELIHPAYVFLYFNLILAAFGYKVWIGHGRKSKKNLVFLIVTIIVDSVLFIYMMFFSRAALGVDLKDVMNRVAVVTNKTVSEISSHESTIKGYLFRTGDENGVQLIINSYWLLFVVMTIVFSPFIYEIFKYWRNVVRNAKEESSCKAIVYVLIPLGVLTTIPMYIMHNDYMADGHMLCFFMNS